MLTVVLGCAGLAASGLLARAARRVGVVTRVAALRDGRPSRLPGALRGRLQPWLDSADVAMPAEAAVQTWILAVLVSALLGLAFAPVLAVPCALAAGAAGPVGLYLARQRRDRRAAEAVPAALERIAAELRGGATVGGAIDTVAAGGGALAVDLRRVRSRLVLGAPVGDALAAWASERDVHGVRAAAGSLALAATVGGPAADALDGLAASLRDRLGAFAEARALSAQARMSAVVVGAGPIGYVLISALIDPGATARMYSTPVGRACLAAGLLLELAGAAWMRALLREAP